MDVYKLYYGQNLQSHYGQHRHLYIGNNVITLYNTTVRIICVVFLCPEKKSVFFIVIPSRIIPNCVNVFYTTHIDAYYCFLDKE